MSRRRLTGDENALWRRATRDVRRLEQGGVSPLPIIEDVADKNARPASGKNAPTLPLDPPLREKSAAPPKAIKSAFEAGDPGEERRVRRRRQPIERTLDLHGLTQAAAHVRLSAFIENASRDGVRCVLVVTGKGRPRGRTLAARRSETSVQRVD